MPSLDQLRELDIQLGSSYSEAVGLLKEMSSRRGMRGVNDLQASQLTPASRIGQEPVENVFAEATEASKLEPSDLVC